ncbi:MAG TPA: fumarate reductase subunit D [Myxococcota bacterium]|nr:fumarate reductase subunit D [Myxococcota bacterium]
MKALMLRLEPVIWLLFGAGMMVGGFVLPAFIATVGLGLVGDADAFSYDRMYALLSNPIARLVALAALALPLWGGAHHLRHVWIDFGGLKSDAVVGGLLYLLALGGSVAAIVAVTTL